MKERVLIHVWLLHSGALKAEIFLSCLFKDEALSQQAECTEQPGVVLAPWNITDAIVMPANVCSVAISRFSKTEI